MDAKQIAALAQTRSPPRGASKKPMDIAGAIGRPLRGRRLQGAVRGARQALRRRRRQDRRLEDRAHPAAPVRAAEALRPGVRRHLPERHPPERRGVRAGLSDQARHRARAGGAHRQGRAGRRHALHRRQHPRPCRQAPLRHGAGRQPLRRRHQDDRPRPHRRQRAAGRLRGRHRDQGLAEARLPQPQGPLAARRQGARQRAPAAP